MRGTSLPHGAPVRALAGAAGWLCLGLAFALVPVRPSAEAIAAAPSAPPAPAMSGQSASAVMSASTAPAKPPEKTPDKTPASSPPGANAPEATPVMPLLRAGAPRPVLRPKARSEVVPHARWAHRPEAILWTRSALAALKSHGRPLVSMIPADIENWCPAYPLATPDERAAFWVGFLSALTKHESTYRPEAVGGGGLWYGLLQILPSTARLYKCKARSGAALKNGSANLSCAIRIMAKTVPRDGVIHGYSRKKKKSRGRGVTADWGPMHSAKKRRDMAGWLKKQSYCRPLSSKRPKLRPEGLIDNG